MILLQIILSRVIYSLRFKGKLIFYKMSATPPVMLPGSKTHYRDKLYLDRLVGGTKDNPLDVLCTFMYSVKKDDTAKFGGYEVFDKLLVENGLFQEGWRTKNTGSLSSVLASWKKNVRKISPRFSDYFKDHGVVPLEQLVQWLIRDGFLTGRMVILKCENKDYYRNIFNKMGITNSQLDTPQPGESLPVLAREPLPWETVQAPTARGPSPCRTKRNTKPAEAAGR